MASFTFTTTAEQDAVVQSLLSAANARRRALDPTLPALTAAQYVESRILDTLSTMQAEFARQDAESVRLAVEGASAAQRAQIRAILGV